MDCDAWKAERTQFGHTMWKAKLKDFFFVFQIGMDRAVLLMFPSLFARGKYSGIVVPAGKVFTLKFENCETIWKLFRCSIPWMAYVTYLEGW